MNGECDKCENIKPYRKYRYMTDKEQEDAGFMTVDKSIELDVIPLIPLHDQIVSEDIYER